MGANVFSLSFARSVPTGCNYELLIGYRSPAEQQTAADVLLHGSFETAIAEIKRAMREEIVILGRDREKAKS